MDDEADSIQDHWAPYRRLTGGANIEFIAASVSHAPPKPAQAAASDLGAWYQSILALPSTAATKKRRRRVVQATTIEAVSTSAKPPAQTAALPPDMTSITVEPSLPWHCNICDETVPSDSMHSHCTSIPHLLAKSEKEAPKPTPAKYSMSERDVGYRLLQRQGWDHGAGLGAEEDGRAYPILARIRHDRLGVGVDMRRSKVGDSDVVGGVVNRIVKRDNTQRISAKRRAELDRREGQKRRAMLAYMNRE